jgi:transposase InsO family protein
MMNDDDLVAASPSSVYRVLRRAGVLDRYPNKPTKKGTGFHQPEAPHEHWHIEVTYISIAGTFYYLAALLDGYSRYLVHWELRESMTEKDIETILQRARERFPHARPRIAPSSGSAV